MKKAVSMSIGDTTEPFDETCNLTLNSDGTISGKVLGTKLNFEKQ